MKNKTTKRFRTWFKKTFVFNKTQIPLFVLFAIVATSSMFLFSNSKTSHYEAVANEISIVAKKSNNNQLTGDFYPVLTKEEKSYSQLSKIINDTKKFNRANYLYYRDNGHKVRVIANGEGRKDYCFKDLPNNPTFILETTFSTAWNQEHLYENYDINLLNKKSNTGTDGRKFFFINETDALYLIEHHEDFKGLTLKDIPGKKLPLTYNENGVEKSEDWTIGNVVLANQLDDWRYKALYGSYIIAEYHLPLVDNQQINDRYCVAFDFSTSLTDNTKFLNHIVPRYSGYTFTIDSRNLINVNQRSLESIVSNYSRLKTFQGVDYKLFIIAAVVILFYAVAVYFWNSKMQMPVLSTCIMIVLLSFVIYSFFFACSYLMSSNIITRAFNSYSIVLFVLLTLYTIFAVLLSVRSDKNKKIKANDLERESK